MFFLFFILLFVVFGLWCCLKVSSDCDDYDERD